MNFLKGAVKTFLIIFICIYSERIWLANFKTRVYLGPILALFFCTKIIVNEIRKLNKDENKNLNKDENKKED